LLMARALLGFNASALPNVLSASGESAFAKNLFNGELLCCGGLRAGGRKKD
jgi:hypothetical protein